MRGAHPRGRRNIKRLQNLPLQLAAAHFSSGIRELSSYLTQLFHFLQFPLNKTARFCVYITGPQRLKYRFHLSKIRDFSAFLLAFHLV